MSSADLFCASWLSDRVLALIASPGARPAEGQLIAGRRGERHELGARWMPCSAGTEDEAAGPWLMTCAVPESLGARGVEELLIRRGEETASLTPGSLEAALCPPAAFGQRCRDRFDAPVRLRIQTFLAASARAHRIGLGAGLGESLLALRDELRDALPTTPLEPGPCSARLESVAAINDRSFWLVGWIHHAHPREARLTAVSPEGLRSVVPAAAISYVPRPAYSKTLADDDTVTTLGFQAFVELDAPSAHPVGWLVEFRMDDGTAVEDRARQPVEKEPPDLMEHVRAQLRAEPLDEGVMSHQVLPMLTAMRGGHQDARVETVVDFGPVNPHPNVSAVVAVRRVDRIQHQLSEFARDPEIHDAELIFVAPDATGRLTEVAEELHELYGVPFRLVQLSRSARRQRALNLGAAEARGRLLALLSGDVLPAEPGWLGALRTFHESSQASGAVGPKLLREDDSIAQAGIEWARRASARWQRTLPLAGLARSVAAAGVPRRVPAVSDACMLLAASDFEATGGFSELYLGDVDEGTDLCLRLSEAGRECWYCPDAELYLLDQPDTPRKASPVRDRFNDWLFNRRCGAVLAAAVVDAPAPEAPASAAFAAPMIPNRGARRPGSPIELLELTTAELAEDGPLLEANLQIARSDPNRQPVLYEDTYAFALTGWAIPRERGPVTIQVRGGVRDIRQMNARLASPKLAERHPDVPGADSAAFQFVIGTLGLSTEFELDVDALLADGTRVALGRVRGRRRPIRSAYQPVLNPLLVTMTGRSGSNWMITLLGSHPEILTYHPFVYEPQLSSYWIAMLRTLADPASYMQALQPELYEADWWTGHGRKSPLPLRKPTVEMAQWFGTENVEVMAGFCQSRLDAFYGTFARLEGRANARYFAEKCVPGTARAISELYPDAREILLVRDFRDRVCSILDYNAKRHLSLWGREKAKNDEEWFVHLRDEATNLLETWRQREGEAHLVRYEDLILEPEQTLAGIFDYLGVDRRPATIRETLARANETSPTAQANHRTAASVQESVGRWKRDLSAEQRVACAEAFDDILVEFGYEPTNGSGGAPAAPAEEQTAAGS